MKTLLLVANYDAGVGYAWWLMESFWIKLAEQYHDHCNVILAYPSISNLPPPVAAAPLQAVEQNFSGTNLSQVFHQCRFLWRHKVESMYLSDWPSAHWRYLLYRLCGVRCIIVHEHTPGVRTQPIGLARQVKKMVHALPWLSVNGAIGASEFVRKRLIQVNCLPPGRCYAASNGLPPLDPLPKAEDLHRLFAIPVERKIIVMTGRAHRYKGIEFILRCLASLRALGRHDLHFLFIGDGPDLSLFENTADELGVRNHCTFPGRRNDIPALLEGADMAMHPSLGEVGYSLSILEYMRAGLPVVVPDNPSVCGATIHEVTGLVYAEGDIQDAATKVLLLATNEGLRHQISENARIAVQNYSLTTTHQALLEAFAKISRSGVNVTQSGCTSHGN